jgi:hypothetical protein
MKKVDITEEINEIQRLRDESKKKVNIGQAVMILQSLKLVKESTDDIYDGCVADAKAVIRDADTKFKILYDGIDAIDIDMRTQIITWHDTAKDNETISGLSWRESKMAIVEDPQKVPAEYMIPDVARINKLVNVGVTNIPGIQVLTKSTPIIKA